MKRVSENLQSGNPYVQATNAGKLTCVLYSIIGIPLCLVGFWPLINQFNRLFT